jgi:hypothetical protein
MRVTLPVAMAERTSQEVGSLNCSKTKVSVNKLQFLDLKSNSVERQDQRFR